MAESKDNHPDHRASNERHSDRRAHHGLDARAGQTGAPSLAGNPNALVVQSFLTYFTPSNTNYGKVGDQSTAGTLMNLFSSDDNVNVPLTYPIVGITDHGDATNYVIGPGFVGQTDIKGLFNQLFSTTGGAFGSLTFKDIGFPWMYSNDQTVIAVRLNLQGTQQGPWFSQGTAGGKHYSLPLSEITPNSNQSQLPTCAVFTFNGSNQITNLALYLDRYKMLYDLQNEPKKNFEKKLKQFINAL
jgi:hypothetical protein